MKLNINRVDYVESIINNYSNVYFNWDRKTGKTTHVLYYIYNYVIKNPNSKVLVILPNNMFLINHIRKIHSFGFFNIKETNTKKITFDNNSEIYFTNKLYGGMECNYDIVLFDDINWNNCNYSIINKLNTFNILNSPKMIISGFGVTPNMVEQLLNIETYLRKKIFIDHYKDDKTLETYLRRKKIKRLQSIIMV